MISTIKRLSSRSLESFYVLKEGLRYGHQNLHQNQSFNDARDHQLSYRDRCIGVELHWTRFSLISIQFLYTNHHSLKKSSARSGSGYSSSFMLDSEEKIEKINLYEKSSEGNSRIVGIEFRTNNGRKSEVFGSNDGHFLTESFEFYTFAYAKGIQSNEIGIESLQFVWIKSAPATEQISTGKFSSRTSSNFNSNFSTSFYG